MAVREHYIGSVGPLLYDDEAIYADGKHHRGFRGHANLHIASAPTDIEDGDIWESGGTPFARLAGVTRSLLTGGGTGVSVGDTLSGDVSATFGSSDTPVTVTQTVLAAIKAVTPAADKVPYFTSGSAAAVADLTSFGRSLIDDANASAARTTLGLGTIATQAANSVAITGGTIDSVAIGASTPSTGTFTVVRAVKSGTALSIFANTVGSVQNSTTTTTDCFFSIISGNAASSRLFFGDTDSESIGQIWYTHGTGMNFLVEGNSKLNLLTTGATVTGVLTASSSSNAIRIGASCDLTTPPAIGSTTRNTGAFTTLAANGVVTVTGASVEINPASGPGLINGKNAATTVNTNAFLRLTGISSDTDNVTSQAAARIDLAADGAQTQAHPLGQIVFYLASGSAALAQVAALKTTGLDLITGMEYRVNGTQIALSTALSDVTITSPVANQALIYDSGTSKWKNQPISAASVTTVIYSNITTVGNVGTGEDNLMSFTVPASQLASDKDSIEFYGVYKAVSGVSSRLRLYFGATMIFDFTVSPIALTRMFINGIIVRTGAATQKAIVTFQVEGSAFVNTYYSTPAETLSGTVVLKSTGEATSNNDIEQYWFKVRYDKTV